LGLRFDPIGGGQFKQAVKQIIEAERQPIKTLEVRKGREEARLKLFQEFKGKFVGVEKALEEFSSFKKFRELKVDLGDGAALMNVTVDKEKAESGSYTLEVEQLAARTSVISAGYESQDENVFGIGFVVADLPNGDSFDIWVDEDNASLKGIATLINQQKQSPVQASVIRDQSDKERPWKLLLTAKKDGLDDEVIFPNFYFLDGLEEFYIEGERDADNALVTIDGFEIEAEGNQINEFLQGVNVQLKQAREDFVFTMTISEDYQKISGKMKALIEQFNGILTFINTQNKIDDKTDTRTTFAGDTGLQTIEYRLRNLLHEGYPVGDPDEDEFKFVFLTEMGIEFEKTGMLKFNEDRFTSAMEKDFNSVAEAITGPYGFAPQMKEVMSNYTRTMTGLLAMRESGLKDRIKRVDEDIGKKEVRMQAREKSLVEQFSRLQGSLGALQRQQQYLSAALPSGGGGGNLVSQLLGG